MVARSRRRGYAGGMNWARNQLEREATYDVRVAVIGLVMFFGCMALLPRAWFWFYFAPMALFWFRYLIVRNRRDAALLQADLAIDSGVCSAGAYACNGGICISDGTHHVLIARQNAKPALNLPDIIRHQ